MTERRIRKLLMEDRWASRVGLEAMQKRFAEERKLVGVQLSEAQEANDHAGEKRASARLKELSAISTRIAEFLKITKDKSQAKAEPASDTVIIAAPKRAVVNFFIHFLPVRTPISQCFREPFPRSRADRA